MIKEESMDEFFACVLNLVNECDRSFEDANLKVETYILSRLNLCTVSLQLLNAKRNNNCASHGKMTKTLSLMLKLINIWSKLLRGYYFKWESIAKIFGIHRTTLWRKINDCDFYAESDVAMSNEELDDLIKSIKNEHPLSGERIIVCILRAKGVSVQRWKIRKSIHCVDPISAAVRWI